ncbi:long-chain fatty acid--CoA ligase [Bradyrhizobium sp. Pear76]|uniref:long-chain fatty acid--CoA ligase n=1 Tax=Bradyrhizobium oropedii TaxID=1571201 RepID=UPI001E3F8ECB|nr:long-chain fatty acid--CoA ligase [Bradyrhizobium oropedii]MCC8960759.1 long-chain fatty acid--CoA ligase [Bradyrhizobium oropedii]
MNGNMMHLPLTIPSLLAFAASRHRDTEVVSCHSGGRHRRSYGEVWGRVNRLAKALLELGVRRGDRVGTIAYNDSRHFELYYAVPSIGAVCHTINPRLDPENLRYVVAHADDRLLFVDARLLDAVLGALPDYPLQRLIALEDAAQPARPATLRYEDLLTAQSDAALNIAIGEEEASGLCYTSGTTGRPKGVLYSHRSTVLFALAMCSANSTAVSALDAVLPAVPMFHVNAWGMPHAAPMAGAKLVLPGADLSGRHLATLFNEEQVSLAIGVPTIWNGLLEHLGGSGDRLPAGIRLGVGGSALPRKMIDAFEGMHGATMIHGWGMTETSPTGAAGIAHHASRALPVEDLRTLRETQGHALWGIDLRLVDDDSGEVAADGKTAGHLQVRGHWVANAYFNEPQHDAFRDGWFDTGDIATIDERGFLTLTDRAKDIIKSGGEWISSVALENIAQTHPAITEAAVIAVPHPKWQERPLLIAVRAQSSEITEAELLGHFDDKVPSWWRPDAVMFATALPRNGNGKVIKSQLRERFAAEPILQRSIVDSTGGWFREDYPDQQIWATG